jgi:hypothetical protein
LLSKQNIDNPYTLDLETARTSTPRFSDAYRPQAAPFSAKEQNTNVIVFLAHQQLSKLRREIERENLIQLLLRRVSPFALWGWGLAIAYYCRAPPIYDD